MEKNFPGLRHANKSVKNCVHVSLLNEGLVLASCLRKVLKYPQKSNVDYVDWDGSIYTGMILFKLGHVSVKLHDFFNVV